MIATPSSTHHELALQALEADKHVFVEKPLALSPPTQTSWYTSRSSGSVA